jgi:HSP20 family protein
MKGTLATNARPPTQPADFRPRASGNFLKQAQKISVAIALRAYELFEARGAEHGHDWEDWFRAESELLTPISAKVVDIDGGFTVRAQIPGFTRKDIEVQAEPRRLIIYGKKQGTSEQQEGRGVLKGKVPDEIFRVLDLPHEIDPDDVRATIKNGVLKITLRMWRRSSKSYAAGL